MASDGNNSSMMSSDVNETGQGLGGGSAANGQFSVTHLPAIVTSRTDPNQRLVAPLKKENVRHYNYRIRGVGSYRVPRETTFEITAPDYDIRYQDVITTQKGSRETPPPDIFEKSVGKVKDWLNKYYGPSNNGS